MERCLLTRRDIFSYTCVAGNNLGNFVAAKSVCRLGLVLPQVTEALAIKEALGWIDVMQWPQVINRNRLDFFIAIQALPSSLTLDSDP